MLRWLLSLVHNSVVAMKAQGHQLVTRARKGDTGAVGISYRVSYWQAGKEYRNDLNNTTASERIIDICVNMPISLIGDANFRAYQCVSTHTSDATTNTLGKVGLWESVNSLKPLVSPLILAGKIVADYIDVDTLNVKKLTVYNASNAIIAKMGDMGDYMVDGVSAKYPFWIGGATPATAVTRIDSTGKLTTSNIVATGSFESSVEEEEYHGNVKITGGAMVYNVSGNGYGGTAIIGYRSSSDRACISVYATQEDPALYVEHTGGSEALRVGKGHIGIAANAGIELYDSSSYIESIAGLYLGFKTPKHRIYSSTTIHTDSYSNSEHTIITWGSNITLTFDATPVKGKEYDIVTYYYAVSIVCSTKYAILFDHGSKTEYSTGQTISLAANNHYKMFYDGTCWIIIKS